MILKAINQLNKRPKLSKKCWITEKEIRIYKSKIVWLFGVADHANSINFTCDRIEKLFKNGHNFAFLYLKECLRLVIRFIAGSPEAVWPGKGIIVARDSRGLPYILDSATRRIFVEWKNHKLLVTAYLTLLSVFRVFPTKVSPKLDTIVSDFSGLSKTFDSSSIRLALKDLFGKRIVLKPHAPELINLESASPNGRKSAWGSSIDALAFLWSPWNFYSFMVYQFKFGSNWFTLWATVLMFLAAPLVIFFMIMGVMPKIHLGKLGVVYDQAGKARVVGITNYWVQLALKPLHNSIFRLLKGIEEDGTFDQTKKINYLRNLGKKFHCFDLSAATDRLPIDIQRDILNILNPSLGTWWCRLLDFPWTYKGKDYKYAVGQPMGAYSSWGMLALTHHVIVKLAAQRVGIKGFVDYAVLGDDIIICDDAVANAYLSIMETLGVSINLSKSVVSNDILEFAKRWMGPNIDITPIGPGLILRYIRSPYYVGAVLNECVRLGVIDNFPKLLTMVNSCPVKDNLLAIWSTVGLGSYWVKMYGDTSNVISYALSSCNDPNLFRYSLWEALLQLRLEKWRNSKLKLEREDEYFYKYWSILFSSNKWPVMIIESLLKLVGPGFWIAGFAFAKDRESLESFPKSGSGSWDDIRDLALSLEEINISSVDWTQKEKVKSGKAAVRKLNSYFERAKSESESYFNC